MQIVSTCQRLLAALVLVGPAGTMAAQPFGPNHLHAQFGSLGSLGSGKILQQFHLPGSPNELFQVLLEFFLKQKLGNTLPLNLDASHTYATVDDAQLPGGAFQGKPFISTPANLHAALAPGDYVVPVMAFCTQYSVHRPGEGTAYKLAPVEGTESKAISALLWRGTLIGKSPQELQATNWAIQAGVPLNSMPKPYQALIEQLIPEYRNGLRGNMLDVIESTYNEVTTDPRKSLQTYIHDRYNKTIPLMLLPKMAVPAPPLDTVLARMGPPGLLLLDAKKQSSILLTAYTTKEHGEELLFEGQGTQSPPEPANQGPWTVRIPGQAYMRLIVKGGNMQGNNLMQIRILPANNAATTSAASHLQLTSFAAPTISASAEVNPAGGTLPATSVDNLLGVITPESSNILSGVQSLTSSGVIGYAVGGGGSQALIAVANPVPPGRQPSATLKVLVHNRTSFSALSTKGQATGPVDRSGLCMYVGAKIDDPDHVYSHYRWIQKVAENEGLTNPPERNFIDDYGNSDPPFSLGQTPISTADPQTWFLRNPAYDSAWMKAAQQLQPPYDLIFRDMPNRKFRDATTKNWRATTELVGVNADGAFDESAALGTVVWGFSQNLPGPITPEPVTINGIPWQGVPQLRGEEAAYLCDPSAWIKADPANHDLPLSPSMRPSNYKQPSFYVVFP